MGESANGGVEWNREGRGSEREMRALVRGMYDQTGKISKGAKEEKEMKKIGIRAMA